MAQSSDIKLPESVSSGIQAVNQTVAQTVSDVKNTMTNTFNQFSQPSQTGVGAPSQFLQANTVIAKIVFILLVLIGFLVLLSLGILFLSYISSPPQNPYLFYGMITGNTPSTISQDPSKTGSVYIQKSNNQQTGIEFTWSFWIFVNDLDIPDKIQHVFNKGDMKWDTNGMPINNGPGVYLKTERGDANNDTDGGYGKFSFTSPNNTDGTLSTQSPTIASGSNNQNMQCVMHIKMDTIAANDNNNTIDIKNIPIRKWIHIAIRMENTILDVYVNGTIDSRLLLQNVPKQNFENVNICQNGGFSGNLSNLRYFNSALNVFDINSIVSWGPNLNLIQGPAMTTQNYFSYLSRNWYNYN